ncbi:TIGR03364 family FAD-dependent oxidoreductase [Jiangella alba]|uniref:FAD dependent oxidoreductase TIGR03364 n=1 Tax=Jiangella alba TaxID=561176 RepID=A0A1H5JBY9_9ACTN|nr:TIGR03364 family FAD-dependent oxidoreductase [Jiangella alba]SEE49930.1 FAD dependent oxidoreductase TIGR03364 [Jiangella alba]
MNVDLVVVGSGIVGLGHALEAASRGLTVAVVEREDRPLGASVRNFGHGCVTAQGDLAYPHALTSRERWLRLAREAGFWAGDTGTVVVARHDDELDVLESLAAERAGEGVSLLTASETDFRAGTAGARGGAFLAQDIRVDPRAAVPAIARRLAEQPGVTFRWSTTVLGVDTGGVRTSRGDIEAAQVVVCVGHDVDHLFPDLAAASGVRRCSLHMLRVAAPGTRLPEASSAPAVLTGLSMLRYPALARQPATARIRQRLTETRPELLELGMNLMFTRHPGGDLLIGDTHAYGPSVDPFAAEPVDQLILDETAQLLGVAALRVRERWRGVYASAPGDFLVSQPAPGTTVVSVTAGIGMTTGLGLAAHVIDDLLAGRPPTP